MAINKFTRYALKALSYPDIDIKKHYKIVRKIINFVNYPYFKSFYKIWDHSVLFQDHKIPVRIFSPGSRNDLPILLFFHGGGWVTGNIDSYNKVCYNMAKITNHIVVSVDYRLAPEYHFPSATNDCYEVAKEINLNPELFNIKQNDITLIGDSAGGNIAAAVSLMARDRGEFMPNRQILIYPATYNNHTSNSPFNSVKENGTGYLLTSKRVCDYLKLYAGNDENLVNPYFAPLLADNLYNQPKTLIITAEYDPLRDEGEAYGKKLKEYGNNVQVYRISDALHGFFSLSPKFTNVKICYEYINKFLKDS